jgi:dynein heavy chain
LQDEWRHLVAGGTHKTMELENPAPEWLLERSWNDILTLSALPKFAPFVDDFKNHLEGYKMIFDSSDPHR